MNLMNIENVRLIGEELKQVIKDHPYGCVNQAAMNDICALGNKAIFESGDHKYIREKVRGLKAEARLLYSKRKHLAYDTANMNGDMFLQGSMIGRAEVIASWSPAL